MKITVVDAGEVIWMKDSEKGEGIASRGHIKDGKQQRLITALEEALQQAKAEMLCWNN